MTKKSLESLISQVLQTPQLRSALGQKAIGRLRRSLRELEVTSFSRLLHVYPKLSPAGKFVALLLFEKRRFRSAVPLLFKELFADDARIAGIAGLALGAIGGRKVLCRLMRIAARCPLRSAKLNAISALCHIGASSDMEAVAPLLTSILADESELPEARALAAEGLANALTALDKRTKTYREGIAVLIRMLDARSPDVRCCCVYALGQLGVTAALPNLRYMADNDHATCPGIGPISDEAREAIDWIQGCASGWNRNEG